MAVVAYVSVKLRVAVTAVASHAGNAAKDTAKDIVIVWVLVASVCINVLKLYAREI